MKYNDFKIFKFSTIYKKIGRIKDSFPSVHKNIKTVLSYIRAFILYITKYIFYRINKSIKHKNIKRVLSYIGDFIIYITKYFFNRINKSIKSIIHYFVKIYKLTSIRNLKFNKVYKYFDIRRYNFYRIDRKTSFQKYKYLPVHFFIFLVFMGFVYVVIPKFYSYDKSKIEKILCSDQNIECSIKGKVYYNFYPTPRIKIKDLIINDFQKKNTLVKAKNVTIKISVNNLLTKEKHKFKKIKLNNFEINFNLNNFKKYRNVFTKNNNHIPIIFAKGKIIFFDDDNYVATINNANLNLKFIQDSLGGILKGKFLNDDIYISLNSKKFDSKLSTDIKLKMSNMNFLIETNFTNSEIDKNTTSGNFLIKKGKNRITAVFDYKDKKFIINKSNLRNTFLDGKLEGKITLLPYFNFNLDLNLKSINFTKLYNHFLSLDEKQQKNLFKINKKINGKLNLSSDKIYSGYNLVKSIESRLQFSNGDILIEQFLINMGKLGASDVLGAVNNAEDFSNFKFESNIFIDNQKKFLSKFGIYNKESVSSNFFISGNFDLENLRSSFYEISGDEELSNDDINFIEEEFNSLMLEEGFKSLFIFPKFKEFIKSITSETN